jgi:hypothetical protein
MIQSLPHLTYIVRDLDKMFTSITHLSSNEKVIARCKAGRDLSLLLGIAALSD